MCSSTPQECSLLGPWVCTFLQNLAMPSKQEAKKAKKEAKKEEAKKDAQREQVKAGIVKWQLAEGKKDSQRLCDVEKKLQARVMHELIDLDRNAHLDFKDLHAKMSRHHKQCKTDIPLILAQTSCWRYLPVAQGQSGAERICLQCKYDALQAYYGNDCDLVRALIALGGLENDSNQVLYKH